MDVNERQNAELNNKNNEFEDFGDLDTETARQHAELDEMTDNFKEEFGREFGEDFDDGVLKAADEDIDGLMAETKAEIDADNARIAEHQQTLDNLNNNLQQKVNDGIDQQMAEAVMRRASKDPEAAAFINSMLNDGATIQEMYVVSKPELVTEIVGDIPKTFEVNPSLDKMKAKYEQQKLNNSAQSPVNEKTTADKNAAAKAELQNRKASEDAIQRAKDFQDAKFEKTYGRQGKSAEESANVFKEQFDAQDAAAKAEAEVKAKAEAEAKAELQNRKAAEDAIQRAKELEDAKFEGTYGRQGKSAKESASAFEEHFAAQEAKAKAEAEVKAKAEAEAKAKAEAEAKAKAEAEAKAKAEAEMKAKAEAEAKAKVRKDFKSGTFRSKGSQKYKN